MGVGQGAPVSSRASALPFNAYVAIGPMGSFLQISSAAKDIQFEDL